MRIVHIYKDYYPVLGGIENHIKQLAEAQVQRGHEVHVLAANLDATYAFETINGVRVTKAPRHLDVQSAPIGFSFGRALQRLTATADIAHLHAPYPIGETFNLIDGRARKTVITWHSDIVRQKTLLRVYAPILRRVIARADRVIASSAQYLRTSPWLQSIQAKCSVVPYGIDTARYNSPSPDVIRAAGALRARAESSAHAPLVLLCAGRLRYYKSFDTLIRALPALPDAVAVIAGIGPMQAAWQALAGELGVSNRTLFLGEPGDDALFACYLGADVFVLPSSSRAEAFGIVNLEAMACELPLVTTEVGSATSWVNQHGVTGFVVPPLNPAQLADAIGKLRDATLRRHMGRAARMRVEAEFTIERMVERIDTVYAEILNSPQRHTGR